MIQVRKFSCSTDRKRTFYLQTRRETKSGSSAVRQWRSGVYPREWRIDDRSKIHAWMEPEVIQRGKKGIFSKTENF